MAEKLTSVEPKDADDRTLAPVVLPIAKPGARERASLRLSLLMQVVAVLLDLASIWAAFWLAYQVRYGLEVGGLVLDNWRQDFSTFAPAAWAAVLILLVVFPSRGVYSVRARKSLLDDARNVFGGYAMVMAGVILFAFFTSFSPSRLVFVYVMIFGIIFMLGHRALASIARTRLHRSGIAVDRVLIVGDGENARRLMQSMLGQAGWGYRLVGYVADTADGDRINVGTERGVLTCPRLGKSDDVGDLVKRYSVDEVVIIGNGRSTEQVSRIVDQCRESVVQFRIVPDLLQISMDRVDISEINGIPTIGVRDASIKGWNAFLKRLMDILISGTGLFFLAIPMGIVAVMIKRDSDGPVFYTQTRVGQYGKPFTMIKFRCMVTNADQMWTELVQTVGGDGRIFKDPNDPRLTKIGKYLRKLSLDELPQLINVLRGDMSIVGPRPPLPKEVAVYEDWHKQRLLVRPGLTGLWQVNGRSDLSFDEMIRLDLYYAENWSPWLDTKILLRTVPAVLLGRGAY
jgi:exopolysaccharide biosynthesis polyprenyl glycosylphosphotransferase